MPEGSNSARTSDQLTLPRLRGFRRLLRFSLRSLLLLILVLSLWLGWQVNRANKQRRAIAQIYELGGNVRFDFQQLEAQNGDVYFDPKKEPSSPEWLRELIGEEYFRHVVSVDLSNTATHDDDLWILDDLPKVESLWLYKTRVTDDAIDRIARSLPRLKGLGFEQAELTDEGLQPLSKLNDLEKLILWNIPIGDDGMQHLAPLTKMRSLILDGTKITGAGLVHLANMHDIDEWLGLCCRGITDDGLSHLVHLKKAKSINLLHSSVTKTGGAWLSKQLPTCRVSY